MISETERLRLRRAFVDAGYLMPFDAALPMSAKAAWGLTLIEASPENVRTLLKEIEGTAWHGPVVLALLDIGIAHADEFLEGVPDYDPDWMRKLRKEDGQ